MNDKAMKVFQELPHEVQRRILKAAEANLIRLQTDEGSFFPAVDRKALTAIYNMMFYDPLLISGNKANKGSKN